MIPQPTLHRAPGLWLPAAVLAGIAWSLPPIAQPPITISPISGRAGDRPIASIRRPTPCSSSRGQSAWPSFMTMVVPTQHPQNAYRRIDYNRLPGFASGWVH